jgi:hypothetical protein
MFADLPFSIQEKIKKLLLKDDFVSAKRIYDDWKRENLLLSNKAISNNPTDSAATENP